MRWSSRLRRTRASILILLMIACIGSFSAARRARDRYISSNAEASVLGERIGKVMPESGRFYTAMVMLNGVAASNAAAADLMRKYGINFVSPHQAELRPPL